MVNVVIYLDFQKIQSVLGINYKIFGIKTHDILYNN